MSSVSSTISTTMPGARGVTYTAGSTATDAISACDPDFCASQTVGFIQVAIASGGQFPSPATNLADYTVTDGPNSGTASTVVVGPGTAVGNVADIYLPTSFPEVRAGDHVVVTISGVSNPSGIGNGPVAISTSSDPQAVPAATPTNVTATAGNASATVSWTAPSSTTSAITEYVVTPYIGATAQPSFVSSSATPSATVGGLTNRTAYTFTVAAVENLGTTPASGASATVTPTPPTGGPPPPPGVAFTTQTLDFGTVAVPHSSSEQSVSLSNTGGQPLTISSVGLTGADAGDFKIDADTCTGQSIASGLGCAVTLTFSPQASGARTAQLAFTDNASGSPQTVSLTGSGTDLGTVDGAVLDGGNPTHPPVSGAGLEICPQVGSNIAANCQSATTGTGGGYSFEGLQAGPWLIQVSSPNPSLFGASAIVQVVAGPQTQNFTLSAPQALPGSVTINGPGGTSHGGVPVLNWAEPFSLSYPANFPSEPAGTEIAYITAVGVFNAGSASSTPITAGALVSIVDYDSAGPVVVDQYPDPAGGADPSIFVTTDGAASAATASAASAGGSGIMLESLPGNVIQANVPSVNEKTHGATQFTIRREYVVVGDAQAQPSSARAFRPQATAALAAAAPAAHGSATRCVVPVVKGRTVAGARRLLLAAHCALGKVTTAYSATVSAGIVISSNYKPRATPPAGTKVNITVSKGPQPKRGPKKKVKVRFSGKRIFLSAAKGPKGGVRVVVHIPPDPQGGDGYYDPSGEVQSTHGIPLGGAKVVLLQSSAAGGPFAQVPDGSLDMSPSTRRNPDHTDALGHFGWDVIPGFYRVTAQHSGCTARSGGKVSETGVYQVPPPVDNVVFKLRCRQLRRRASHVSLGFRALHGSVVLVTAHVRGRHPAGAVTFSAGALRTAIALNPATHTAVLVVTSSEQVRVRYQGDADNAPSAARGRS